MSVISRFSGWLYASPAKERSVLEIIIWWEKRRVSYNFIVGIMGFVFFLLYAFFVDRAQILKPGEDIIEPMALFVVPIFWNFAYTMGWAFELGARKIPLLKDWGTGSYLLRWGINFSLFLLAIPAIYWGAYCLFTWRSCLGNGIAPPITVFFQDFNAKLYLPTVLLFYDSSAILQ